MISVEDMISAFIGSKSGEGEREEYAVVRSKHRLGWRGESSQTKVGVVGGVRTELRLPGAWALAPRLPVSVQPLPSPSKVRSKMSNYISLHPIHFIEFPCTISCINVLLWDWLCLRRGNAVLWASLVAQMVKNLPAMQETGVQSLGWEDPLEKGMTTHSGILGLKNSMGRGA